MRKGSYEFTSESVTEGHPDKICDQVVDAILDEMLRQDPNSRVALECMVTTGSVHVAGEVTTEGYVDIQGVVRKTLRDIGYTSPEFGIDCNDAGVWVSIHSQSADISQGVNNRKGSVKEQGAGDQGMMFGYACRETKELMPLPIMLAHRLTMRLAHVRKRAIIKGIGPDGKSQVTVQYEDERPRRVSAVVIAQQHVATKSLRELRGEILENAIKPVCGDLMDRDTKIYINATGRFVIGGPEADTGVTGRKIMVDTYGGMGRHGGGCFSGKDPSKVDRSGAYVARYIAKNIVAARLCEKGEVQIAYAIGIADPVALFLDTYGTARIPEPEIIALVKKHFPLKPGEIIEKLRLKTPIYKRTAAYGHFGRSHPDFTWERTDKAAVLIPDCNQDDLNI